MIDLISKAGAGVKYQHTVRHVDRIACAVQQNIEKNGTYIPPKLMKGRPLRAAIDNLDSKVDTPDGKLSFHALAGSIFQEGISLEDMAEYVAEPVKLDNYSKKLTNVPQTGIELMACPILENPKPKSSPCYPDFKPLQHQQLVKQYEMNDKCWLLIRHCSRTSTNIPPINDTDVATDELSEVPTEAAVADVLLTTTTNKLSVPGWGAYNSIVASSLQKNRCVDMVHALPLINAPPCTFKG